MRPSIAVLALVVACTQGAAPTTTEATTTTVPTTTSTSLPTTTTTLQAGVAWDQISASPWLVSDYQGVRTAGGDVLWEPSLLLGGAGSIVRDGEGGFAWADGDGLWWLPAGAPQPRLVMTGVQQVFRAIPTAGAPAALIWVDDSAHPFWIDLDTGEREEPEAPGLVTLDDPYLTAVWYAANGLAAVVTAPNVLHDAEGQPTTIESPGRLIVGYAPDPESGYTEKTILTRDSTGDLVINLDGPHVLNVALSTLESPWVRLHDFDGQRIIVSRGPFEPAMPEESFLYIDLGCGSCFTVFRASAAWAVLVGTDPTDVPVFDRQAPQLLASWPGTDAGVTELGDGVYVGYLDPTQTTTSRLTFDLAVWFSGLDADRAAGADGSTEIPVPNDYYIRNLDARTFTFPVAANIEATSVWYDYDTDSDLTPEPVAYSDVVGVLTSSTEDIRSHLRYDPWWITIEDGKVVRLDEQYVP